MWFRKVLVGSGKMALSVNPEDIGWEIRDSGLSGRTEDIFGLELRAASHRMGKVNYKKSMPMSASERIARDTETAAVREFL